MKDNCKNRKLNRIRFKNNFRLGKKNIYKYAKISNELLYTDIFQKIVIDLMRDGHDEIINRLRLKKCRPIFSSYTTGQDGEDFIQNKTTIRAEFYTKK